MTHFELRFAADDIIALASRFAYDKSDVICLEIGEAARGRGRYTRDEFLTVCAWKTARSRSKVEANASATVESVTAVAMSSSDERTRMDALVELQGVGVPTASTLLYFAFPDHYPILDVRALESLGCKGRSTYTVDFWIAYLEACRALASRHRVPIRTLDKALWQFSKEQGR